MTRATKPRFGRLTKIAALCVGLAAVSAVASLTLRKQPQDAAADGSLYYRVTTKLETEGQPFELDVIVHCRGLSVVRGAGGTGVALDFEQIPYLFGRPTPAGHAVLMRVPNYCDALVDRQAASFKASLGQRAVLPLLLWAKDQNDLRHMTAYTSLKGYEGEGARLRHLGTRVAEASREDWLAWLEREGKPFVTRANDPVFQWNSEGSGKSRREARGPWPLLCAGLRPFRIPAEFAAEVENARPAGDPVVWKNPALASRIGIRATDIESRRQDEFGPGGMSATRGAPGVDLIPYEAYQVRSRDEPLAASIRWDDKPWDTSPYEGDAYLVVRRVNLGSPIRGRAECAPAYSARSINLVTIGGREGRVDTNNSRFFAAGPLLLDFERWGAVDLIEGSYEGMFP